ncbi:glycine zipper 2TM domain-containing protein [Methyloversatilis universalis]|uniref:glycine zipper 2TM domain-containing protein n=1 Tax=Methyloversatilis universalis TaxID=378211 RepID=UPI00035CA5DE|nr:glycine zipper 2TM domain-containing protein [Methyloversatilis universalis]
MNTQASTVPTRSLHPALWVAAVSVTAFSAVGIAKLTGAFDTRPAEPAVVATAAAPLATPAAPAAPVAAATPAPETAPVATAPDSAPRKPATEKRVHSKPAVHHSDTVTRSEETPQTIKVADRRYDPGIDVIPAPAPGAAMPPPPPVAERAPAPLCADCGQIESVREVKAPADPSGLGAAAGGVVGGLLGNQVGKGSGRTIATLIGIAGGAYAGHQVEKTQRTVSRWEVGVRMENGEYRTVAMDSAPSWRTGDRVRLQGGSLVAAGY